MRCVTCGRWPGDLGVRGDVEMARREKARADAAKELEARIAANAEKERKTEMRMGRLRRV